MNFIMKHALPVYMGALIMLCLRSMGLGGFVVWGIFLAIVMFSSLLIIMRDEAVRREVKK